MIRAWSVADVRAMEARAMEARAMQDLPDGELMQRAARGLAEVADARLQERDGQSVVALVGAGNNGGDALFALAMLAGRGFACGAVLLADEQGTHAEGLSTARQAGAVVVRAQDADAAHDLVRAADLVLDGIVGIGGTPGLREPAAALVRAVPDTAYVIAVDLASGLDPEGRLGLGPGQECVWADETVTFGVCKPAHLLPPGEPATGVLTVVDIGLDTGGHAPAVQRLDWDDVAQLWPVPGPTDDKYRRGVLGVIAGSQLYPGAAVLTVTAAVECGAGMVRYVGPPTPLGLVRHAVPEAVSGEGCCQAWVVGPGMDGDAADADSRAQVAAARRMLGSDLPVAIDAGGLDLVGTSGPEAPGRHVAFGMHRGAPTLLTPHAGECARLLTRLGGIEVPRDEVEREPVTHASRLAELTGATVLLKGATTVVVGPDPDQPVRSQSDAPAWLATAGSGDVLSGVVGTLLAAGLDPLDAGALAALVHGVAADTASPGGPVRALRVAHALPAAVRRLLARGGAVGEPAQ